VSGSGVAGSSRAGEGGGGGGDDGGAGGGDREVGGDTGAGGDDGDGSTFTDPRDGEVYKTAVIPINFGEPPPLYLWLAENLRWQPPVGFSHCADGTPESCRVLGRFYDYVAALNGSPPGDQGVCPDGWRLPTEGFLQEMVTWNGSHQQLTNKLKSSSGWATMQGLDQWGFNGRPFGYYAEDLSDTERHGIGEWALFWGSSVAWGLPDKAPAYVFYNWGAKAQFNVRCFKAL